MNTTLLILGVWANVVPGVILCWLHYLHGNVTYKNMSSTICRQNEVIGRYEGDAREMEKTLRLMDEEIRALRKAVKEASEAT